MAKITWPEKYRSISSELEKFKRKIDEAFGEEDDVKDCFMTKKKEEEMPEITLKLNDGRYVGLEATLGEDGIEFDVSYDYRLKDQKDIDCLINFLKLAKAYYE